MAIQEIVTQALMSDNQPSGGGGGGPKQGLRKKRPQPKTGQDGNSQNTGGGGSPTKPKTGLRKKH